MLKSFDRAFWMRYIKLKDIAPKESLKEFSPLKNQGVLMCPFGDPEKYSFLEFRIKKLNS